MDAFFNSASSHDHSSRRASYLANGEQLRRMRRRLGKTQNGLATEAGISERVVRKAENGERIDSRTLQRLVRYLGKKGLAVEAADLISVADLAEVLTRSRAVSIARNWLGHDSGGCDDAARHRAMLADNALVIVNGQIIEDFDAWTAQRAAASWTELVITRILVDGAVVAAEWWAGSGHTTLGRGNELLGMTNIQVSRGKISHLREHFHIL